MADKHWESLYPGEQDPTPVTGVQPTLVDGEDRTLVSQIHCLRDKLQAVALKAGDDNALPAGCLRAHLNDIRLHGVRDDEAGEIHAITEKAAPVDADEIIIEDSAASYAKKRVQLGNLSSGGPSLWFSDDTEFTETGAAAVTKKTFRLVLDSTNKPGTLTLVASAWVTGGAGTVTVTLTVGSTSNTVTTTSGSEAIVKVSVATSGEAADSLLTVLIRLHTTANTAHIKYTDLYAVY